MKSSKSSQPATASTTSSSNPSSTTLSSKSLSTVSSKSSAVASEASAKRSETANPVSISYLIRLTCVQLNFISIFARLVYHKSSNWPS